MADEARKQRAVEAVTKYKGTLTSDERIAAFAVWFAAQEFGWKDTHRDPPTDRMLGLLKDTNLNVVRLGYRPGGGGWGVSGVVEADAREGEGVDGQMRCGGKRFRAWEERSL